MKVSILALICAILIAVLEAFAIYKGIDGVALSVSIGAIAGLGGYGINEFYGRIKR